LPDGVRSATTEPGIIRHWWRLWPDANVGIATGDGSFDVLDIDLKGDGPDTLAELEAEHGALPSTIEQITGSGGRQVMFSPCGKLTNAVKFASGLDIRTNGGFVVVPPSLHSSGNLYEWEVSSDPANGVQLAPVPPWLLDIAANSNGKGHLTFDLDEVWAGIEAGRRDDVLFRYAQRLFREGRIRPEVELLVRYAATLCKPPFPEADAMAKVAQAEKYSYGLECVTGLEDLKMYPTSPDVPNETRCPQDVPQDVPRMYPRTDGIKNYGRIAKEVREWLDTCDGTFSLKEIASEFRAIAGSTQYGSIKRVLHRLHKDNIIARVGDRSGVYRRITQEDELQPQEWWNCSDDEYVLDLPLDISSLVRLSPKSIIVIAGEQNSCKTAFSLDIARRNCKRYNTVYFNSEMSDQELLLRLSKFDEVPITLWRNITFFPRTHDFDDVIRPDSLNIIDFLEIHDEFWRIGGIIRRIYDRLNTGCCVINLQKPRGRDEGRGGMATLEKPRLALALSTLKEPSGRLYNTCKITKAKMFRDPEINPNSMIREFRLYHGSQILPLADWHHERL
jgi:hypothetical protein